MVKTVEQISLTIGLASETVDSYLAQARGKYERENRPASTVRDLRERLIEDNLLTEDTVTVNPVDGKSRPTQSAEWEASQERFPYRVIFERAPDNAPRGGWPIVSVFMTGGALPSTLVNPPDRNGLEVEGTWELKGIVEAHRVAFYARVYLPADAPDPSG